MPWSQLSLAQLISHHFAHFTQLLIHPLAHNRSFIRSHSFSRWFGRSFIRYVRMCLREYLLSVFVFVFPFFLYILFQQTKINPIRKYCALERILFYRFHYNFHLLSSSSSFLQNGKQTSLVCCITFFSLFVL